MVIINRLILYYIRYTLYSLLCDHNPLILLDYIVVYNLFHLLLSIIQLSSNVIRVLVKYILARKLCHFFDKFLIG